MSGETCQQKPTLLAARVIYKLRCVYANAVSTFVWLDLALDASFSTLNAASAVLRVNDNSNCATTIMRAPHSTVRSIPQLVKH